MISELHSLLFPPRNLCLHLLLYKAIPPTARWAVAALLSLHHIKPRITKFLTIPEGTTSTGAPFRLSRITLLALPRQSRSSGQRCPRQRIAELPAQLPARSRAAVPPRHLAAAAGEKPRPIPAVRRAARGRSGTGRGLPTPPVGPGIARGKELHMEPT